jgi:hypothetical protein
MPLPRDVRAHARGATRAVLAAAALRAAADQVGRPAMQCEPRNPSLPMALECQRIRAELLAIAAELESQ